MASPSIRVRGWVVQGGVVANNVAVVATGPGKVAIENAELLGASGMYATFGAQVDMKGGRILAQYQCHRKPGLRRWSLWRRGPDRGRSVNLEGTSRSVQLAWGPPACGCWATRTPVCEPTCAIPVIGEVAAIALGFNDEANISGGSLSVEDGAVLTTLTPDAVEYYYDYALSMEHPAADAPLTPVRVTLSDDARASGETLIAHGGLLPMTLR